MVTAIHSSDILKVTHTGAAAILNTKVDTLTPFTYDPGLTSPTRYPSKYRESCGVYSL
jgi:hypothetical protein